MMRDHQVRIESGDCLSKLALLPKRSVDHVITDPPYSAWVHERSRVPVARTPQCSQRRAVRRRELGFESMTQELRVAVAREWARLVRRWVLVFTDCESSHLWREALTSVGLEYVRTCYWHKLRATPQLTGDRPADHVEHIVAARQPGAPTCDSMQSIIVGHRKVTVHPTV